MSDETETPKLWERQPWDTPTSWAVFHAYLEQDETPRSLRKAYSTVKGLKESGRDIPGGIRNRLHGLTSDGVPIPGAVDYTIRVEAWENYIADLERHKWVERRLHLREKEWEVGSQLLQRGEEMLLFPVFRQEVEEGKPVIMPAKWTYKELPAVLVQASKLMRLSTGMSTENVAIDWRDEARKEGFDPDELFNEAVAKFRAKLESETESLDRSNDPGCVERGEAASVDTDE